MGQKLIPQPPERGPIALSAERDAIRALRRAVLALHDDAREVYLEEAVEHMKRCLLMEELGK